jgi:hypothetical protein
MAAMRDLLVRVTFRLTDSSACVMVDEHELPGNLLRKPKARARMRWSPNSSWKSTRTTRWSRFKCKDASGAKFMAW